MWGESSPEWGRAPGWLETLTTTAGRAASAGSAIGRPVSGMTGSGAMVVDVEDVDAAAGGGDSSPVAVAALGGVVAGEVSAVAVVADDALVSWQATSANPAATKDMALPN